MAFCVGLINSVFVLLGEILVDKTIPLIQLRSRNQSSSLRLFSLFSI